MYMAGLEVLVYLMLSKPRGRQQSSPTREYAQARKTLAGSLTFYLGDIMFQNHWSLPCMVRPPDLHVLNWF